MGVEEQSIANREEAETGRIGASPEDRLCGYLLVTAVLLCLQQPGNRGRQEPQND